MVRSSLPPPVGAILPTSVKDTPDPSPTVSVHGLKRCAVAPSGAEACWELADPAMTAIPDRFLQADGFLQANPKLTGTLRVGPAVQTIGALAFAYSTLTSLDLSEVRPRSWRSGSAPSVALTSRARSLSPPSSRDDRPIRLRQHQAHGPRPLEGALARGDWGRRLL